MTATAAQVAGAVLLPPFGVYLKDGGGRDFWIAVALTMLAVVPGILFALWRVLAGTPRVAAGDARAEREAPAPAQTGG